MTAVVGILNKQAVAIAADSAVTIEGNNGRKIFNKANKVFTLSKYHPVAIMIHNAASFMTTPWEVIIKIYRRQLGDTVFTQMQEYVNDFIEFLRAKTFFTDVQMQLAFLEDFSRMIINTVIDEAGKANPLLLNDPTEGNRAQFLQLVAEKAAGIMANFAGNEPCPEYDNYTFEEFTAYSQATIDGIIQQRFANNGFTLSPELDDALRRLVFTILKAKESITNYTGLIFAGFGEDEIYPQLIPINISMVVNDRLRYYRDDPRIASISNMNNAAICPFAQTDVIDTILTGVDPTLDNIYLNNFAALFSKYNNEILAIVGNSNPQLAAQIQALNIDVLLNEYRGMNERIKRLNHIQPLLDAVGTLSKEDLAEMAESLIYLTYLKRRITFAEESVGGPVDVAVISKGDGLVWIKRKHYFRPELNQHFFSNYFKQ
jgi:hypothetical protein